MGSYTEREGRWTEGRIVAKGFQKGEKPQSDSPTLLRESLKMYFALATNEALKLRSIIIRAVFWQANSLDREVYNYGTTKRCEKGRKNFEVEETAIWID